MQADKQLLGYLSSFIKPSEKLSEQPLWIQDRVSSIVRNPKQNLKPVEIGIDKTQSQTLHSAIKIGFEKDKQDQNF